MTTRRFPPPWRVEQIPGGLQSCRRQRAAYVYLRKNSGRRGHRRVLTEDEAHRIASNIAKLPERLG
jgi:hypothetical protein